VRKGKTWGPLGQNLPQGLLRGKLVFGETTRQTSLASKTNTKQPFWIRKENRGREESKGSKEGVCLGHLSVFSSRIELEGPRRCTPEPRRKARKSTGGRWRKKSRQNERKVITSHSANKAKRSTRKGCIPREGVRESQKEKSLPI